MIRIKRKRDKQMRVIDLKLEVLSEMRTKVQKFWNDFSAWCGGTSSDRTFSVMLVRNLDRLDELVSMLKKRSENFGELEEKVIAKNFHEVYEELAPKFHYKTQKKSQCSWDSLTVDHQDLMIATVRKVLQRFLVKE